VTVSFGQQPVVGGHAVTASQSHVCRGEKRMNQFAATVLATVVVVFIERLVERVVRVLFVTA
jgi:hypothetical protein